MTTKLRAQVAGAGPAVEVGVTDGVISSIAPTRPGTDDSGTEDSGTEDSGTGETGAGGTGMWLVPGLLDLQVNGYAGVDFNDGHLEAAGVGQVVHAEWQLGAPAICPTLITGPEERILDALAVIAAARRSDPMLRHAIPCVHVEGPHLSTEEGPRGAHDPAFLRPPDINELARWQRAAEGAVGIVTIAPELPGALDYIKAAVAQGVVVSLGHSAATREQITAAADAGAALSTHLGNGCALLLPRHDNQLWPQLADDRLAAGFIADGHHLPADMFVAMTRAKGVDRSVLISDSVALAGSPPGRYRTAVGGEVELSPSQRLSLAGSEGKLLAGSVSSLTQCLSWAIDIAGLAPVVAFQMATANPWRVLAGGAMAAEALGRGALRIGAPADLSLFQHDPRSGWIEARAVLVAGVPVLAGHPYAGKGPEGPHVAKPGVTADRSIGGRSK